jgi:ATPase family associated with various cellular activities (AAA)
VIPLARGYEYYTYNEKPVVVSKNAGFQLLEDRGHKYIDLRDPKFGGMRDYVYSYLTNSLEDDMIDDFGHRYPVSFLADYVDLLNTINHPQKEALVTILLEEKQRRVASYEQRKAKGVVEMSDIETVFPAGTEIVAKTWDEGLIGGIVKSVQLQRSFFSGVYWEFTINVVHAVKGEVAQGLYTYSMPGFRGLVPLADLPVRTVTKKDKAFLTERGKRFARFLKPGTYVAYKGTLEQPSWWNARTFRADGRVVIDPISFERQEPEVWRNCIARCGVQIEEERSRGGQVRANTTIEEKDYWRCLPQLYGFSLSVKQWGKLDLDGMTDIQWRDDAWDKLVVEEDKKDMIYSLVKFHGSGFTDIIEGKGGGTIFLLHGPPGWGKTASAEAVAELLHKPLYSVGVGELGTSTDTLEKKLRNILDVAVIWDAVLLLDEADIFLEERDEHNIERNAMVGVFLRLLEYHNGVLFLTTNRVRKIDQAFYSRISVALLYGKEGKAFKVWHNLLGAAGLNQEWAEEMSGYDVNGRQIKNSIRMAMTLAKSKDRKIVIGDLIRAVTASLSFENDMKNAKDVTPAIPTKLKAIRRSRKPQSKAAGV